MTWLTLVLALVLVPLLVMSVDGVAVVRSRNRAYDFGSVRSEDFQILVPIWGLVKYLENVEYLAAYGPRVTLCTTGNETEEFYDGLRRIAGEHGFQIFRDQLPEGVATRQVRAHKKRDTSGTIRDRLIRNALATVTAKYVIPLDADSTTNQDMSVLAGELERRGLDIASIRLVPRNQDSFLAKLQSFEYRQAMQFRFVAAWLLSGACHVAKTEVLRDIMDRHSLFFQGNDVEAGLIARARGYRIGHIPFEVLTTVPSSFRPWFRQRLAWAGGEFRLFIMNFWFAFRHPFLWFYGGIVTICAFPLRWAALATLSYPLITALVMYLVLTLCVHRRAKSGWLLLMPLNALFSSLVMTPLGVLWYFYMAVKDGNFGIIRPHRKAPSA
jgi:cellulose synthase/poly-beta-1,6-N-acetylglucosamine synthase-like glycosyltransferase